MTTTLTGILAWIFALCTGAIMLLIIILGTIYFFNLFILVPLHHQFGFSKLVYEYWTKRNELNKREEKIEQKEKELKMLEISHHDSLWFNSIEKIVKGYNDECFDYQDKEWIQKIRNIIESGKVKDPRLIYEMSDWNNCLKMILNGRRTQLFIDPNIDQEMAMEACRYLGYSDDILS